MLTACVQEETNREVDDASGEPQETDTNNLADQDGESTDDFEVSQNLESWIPKLENVQYDYIGEGMEYSSFTMIPQFSHANTWQFVEENEGTTTAFIYEYSGNEIVEIFSRPETYFREDFVDTGYPSATEDDILLQTPIEEGHSWESPNGAQYKITGINVPIDTPSGSYETIEVSRTNGDNELIRYYAEEVGLVHEVFEMNSENEVTSSLATITEEAQETRSMTFYTLDDQAMGINPIEAELTFETNNPPRIGIADALAGGIPEMENATLLPENVEINYLFIDEEDIAHVDFSEELLSEVQAGAGIESMILQSIINTIGDYYMVEDILLTVENEPYSSGHIALDEGETMTVDFEQVNSTE